jgi:aspartate 1-decarboxylase
MFLKALKGKIHRGRVTQTKVDYPGSIAIDADMLKAAGINTYEEVLVANVSNGQRVETYVIPAPAGGREIIILGAAAKLFEPGDIVIIINFGYYSPEELKKHKPSVLLCDDKNNFKMME